MPIVFCEKALVDPGLNWDHGALITYHVQFSYGVPQLGWRSSVRYTRSPLGLRECDDSEAMR